MSIGKIHGQGDMFPTWQKLTHGHGGGSEGNMRFGPNTEYSMGWAWGQSLNFPITRGLASLPLVLTLTPEMVSKSSPPA